MRAQAPGADGVGKGEEGTGMPTKQKEQTSTGMAETLPSPFGFRRHDGVGDQPRKAFLYLRQVWHQETEPPLGPLVLRPVNGQAQATIDTVVEPSAPPPKNKNDAK